MRRWFQWSGVAIVLVVALVLEIYAESRVGSAEIGRDTMKMYRQKRTGQTELSPRRVQSAAAPKRIFQEQQATAEAATESQPAPADNAPDQPTPAIAESSRIVAEPNPTETMIPPAVAPTPSKPAVASPEQTSRDELLALLPETSIACIRVNNLDYTLALLDQYLMGITPVPMVATIGARTGLAQITRDQNLQAINTGGNLAIVVLPPQTGQEDPTVGLLTPVKDSNSAEALKGSNYAPVPNTGFGIFSFPAALSSLDPFTSKSLQPSLTARQLDETATAPIWLYVNMPKAAEFLAPLAESKMQEQAAANPQLSTAISQVDQIKQIGEEIQCVSMGIYPSGPMLTLDMDLIPVPGSSFASSLNKTLFSQQPTPEMDEMTRGLLTLMQSLKVQNPSQFKDAALVGIRNPDKADFMAAFTLPELIGQLTQIVAQQPG